MADVAVEPGEVKTSEEEVVEETEQDDRDAKVLQLFDTENNIDAKEIEDEPMDVNETKGQSVKLDASENSITSPKGYQSDQVDDAAESSDTKDKAASQSIPAAVSTPTKGKFAGKTSLRMISKQTKITQPAKSIWVTNLPLSTRAADLKTFFAKNGKVILVQIISAKQTSGKKNFYGYITLSTSKEAAKAVQELNNTEFNGEAVKLELTNDQSNTLVKKAAKVVLRKVKGDGLVAKSSVKAKEKVSDSKEIKTEEKETKDDRSSATRRDRERDHRSRENRDFYSRAPFWRPFGFRGRAHGRGGFSFRERAPFRRPFGFRGRAHGRGGFSFRERAPFRRPFGFRGRGHGGFSFRERPPIESFRRPFGRKPFFCGRMGYRPPMKPSFMQFKMREEQQRERMRDRSIRESERRLAEDTFRQKLIERKQRKEAYRLEREKVQLRIEREMLEREKAEYLKNEREKQRMEREREKLCRQAQIRAIPSKRPFPFSPVEREPVWEKEKRVRHYENQNQSFSEKSPSSEGRPDFREPPPGYRKFEHRPDHYEREVHSASTSRSDFSKYGKERSDPSLKDHDGRPVYKRPYFKEDVSRSYPPRDTEGYAPPPDDRGYKRKMHEPMPSPRPRGGGGGRRMSC